MFLIKGKATGTAGEAPAVRMLLAWEEEVEEGVSPVLVGAGPGALPCGGGGGVVQQGR